MATLFRFWITLFGLFIALPALALPPGPLTRIDNTQPRHSLDAGTWVLRDPSGQLSLEQVLNTDASEFQQASARRSLHFGYTPDHVWLVQRLSTDGDVVGDWLLELESPYLDRVTLFINAGDGWTVMESGATLPTAERVIRHRQSVFPVSLVPGEPVTLVLHVRAKGSMTLNYNLWQPQSFYEQSDRTYVIMAGYYGMLLALGLYNLLLFFGIRQISFLLYSGFVFSFAAAVLTINGIGPLMLWPNLGDSSNRILPTGFTLAATLAFLFARSFLDTRQRSPRWNRVLWLGAVIGILASAASLAIPVQTALKIMSLYGVLTTIVLLSCGISCAVRKVPGARIFVAAWALLLTGTSLLALRNLGILPSNAFTVYSIQLGSALEMLLLSLALAAQFNKLKRQKEEAQEEMVRTLRAQEARLEQMVAERTEALAQANSQLAQQALHDSLTGLLNRAGLMNQLDAANRRAVRHQSRLAGVMIDLDGFKPINDQFGHAAGDIVLQVISKRLQACARGSDLIARFGGDEFVLIAEDLNVHADAAQVGERLLTAVSVPITLASGEKVTVSASIGIHLSDGTESPEVLLLQADQAMYVRKKSGKAGVSISELTGG